MQITPRQRRILRQVRTIIDTGQVRYLCFALQAIAEQDHRRAVQDDCVALAAHFKQELDGHNSLGDYLARHDLPLTANTLIQARLAWIDRTLEN